MLKFFLDELRRLRIAIEVRLFDSHFQVAATREIAVNLLLANNPFNAIDSLERSRVHPPHSFDPIAFNQLGNGQLQAC